MADGRFRGLGQHPRRGVPVSPVECGGRAGIGHDREKHNQKVASLGGHNGREEGMVKELFFWRRATEGLVPIVPAEAGP